LQFDDGVLVLLGLDAALGGVPAWISICFAWMAAYLGGVLCTNLFLVSVVLGRRGYWDRPVGSTPRTLETAETRAVTGVRVPLMVSLR